MFLNFLFVFQLSANSYADDSLSYKDAASLAKGNLYFFSNSPTQSFYYAPGNLKNEDKFSLTLINANGDFSSNSLPLIRGTPNPKSGELYDTFKGHFGKDFSLSASAVPIMSYRGYYLIPIYASGRGEASLENPVFSTVTGYYFYDYGFGVGKVAKVNKNIDFGVSILQVRRTYEYQALSAMSLLQQQDAIKEQGQTLTPNLGLSYSLRNRYDSKFSFSYLNIGSPKIIKKDFVDENERRIGQLKQEFNVGAYSKLPFLMENRVIRKLRLGLELHNFEIKDNPGSNNISFGAEYPLLDWVNLRTGLSHGCLSYGAGINTRFFSVDIASYGERTRLGYSKENRNYIVSLKFGINIL